MTRFARRAALLGLLALAAPTGGCADDTGVVELAWLFVDRDGDAIYPGGVFTSGDERDSCDLPGLVGGAEARDLVGFDLRVELEICDPGCAAGCDAEECLVVPRHVFPCTTARGNDPDVPASAEETYRFSVRAVLDAPGLASACRDPDPSCLAVPAPRERVVTAGRVTDLQVFQIVVDVDRQGDAALDLEACGCA
jgi:hypothetical protein